MSISLPNGTLLAAPSSSTQQYTAAVTRILHLANFSPELKTRDLQVMFRDYEADKGGFRIKWLDDVNALLVFADPAVAKRAYLAFILHPPPHFLGNIKPYDRPDANQIIQSLAARQLGHRGSTSIATDPSSQPSIAPHGRTMSTSSSFGQSGGFAGVLGNAPSTGSKIRASISGPIGRTGHNRTGSTGASGSGAFSRQSLSGALGFGGGGGMANRLPTHSENNDQNRSNSSSDTEPIISLEPPGLGSSANGGANFGNWKMGMGRTGGGARRDSLSADKALQEVQKALAGVDVHG